MRRRLLKGSFAAAFAAALALSGCATYEVVEPPVDPFGQSAAPAFPDLSLAVLVDDADVTFTFEGGFVSAHKPLRQEVPTFDALSALVATLRGHFKKVDRVSSAWEAQNKGYDLVATIKVDVFTKGKRNEYDKYSVSLAFADPKGAPIETIKAEGKSMDFQDFGHGMNGGNTFEKARERAMKFLSTNLRQAVNLPGYAANRRSDGRVAAAPAAAPAPAPAPAPKAFRADAETPSFSRPEDPTKYALVVGVEKYSDLPAAEHAGRDAAAVKAHLLALGYPERNIVYLIDQKALKTGLEKYLESWLPRNTDEKSTVFFYFSGHGAPDPATGQAYLVPWDGDPKFIDTTGYPVKRLYEKLNALKARQVLVAIDSCFSGVGGRSVIAHGTRPLVGRLDVGASAAGKVCALTASASDEISGVDEDSGHGLFTYQLLKALDARGGKVTMKEIYDALSPKVRDAARRDNRDQTPQLIGNGAATP